MAAKRACPGCSTPIPKGTRRCAACAREYETNRGGRQARGYDQAHVNESQSYRQRLRNGDTLICWRCGEPITDPTDMDLGHDDHDRTITRGPEHAKACNRREAGRIGNQNRNPTA